MQVVDDMIQDDDGGAEEDLAEETRDIHIKQQGDCVPTEAQDDVLESWNNTEPLSSTAIRIVSEYVQVDNAPPEPLPMTDYNSELRESSHMFPSTSAAVHVSLDMEPFSRHQVGTILGVLIIEVSRF